MRFAMKPRNLVLPALAIVAAFGMAGADRAKAGAPAPITGNPPPEVASVINDIEGKAAYAHSLWGIHVADLKTGEVLIDQAGDKTLVPGSIMKVYSTSTVLDAYGTDYRFHTPVYRVGEVRKGTLRGNLVLVASGDFSFGLRDQPDGTLAFNSFPEIDHNYADTGFPGTAIVKGSNPLAALDELAGKVKAAGIKEIRGNVIVDDRLFATYRDWNDGPISPIWLNENVVDITTTPASAGKEATVDWRPKIAGLKIVSDVMTVASDPTPITIDQPRPGVLRVRGQIAADSPPALRIWQVKHPASFARTAFVEALARAGVKVTAGARGANPEKLLPKAGSYAEDHKVAEHVSPPLSQFVKVILKVSYNRGADLMLCLVAVKAGSRDCAAGIASATKLLDRMGVAKNSTYIFDGAGSDDHGHTAPADEAGFLARITSEPWGAAIRGGMAVLGVDGTQALNGVGTPAAGHIQIKDGSRVAPMPGGSQGIIIAKTQVGYIEAKSGRQLVYGVFLNNTAYTGFEDFMGVDHDVAAIGIADTGGVLTAMRRGGGDDPKARRRSGASSAPRRASVPLVEPGRDFALVAEDLDDVADAGDRRDVVDVDDIGQRGAALGVYVACECLRLERIAGERRPGLGEDVAEGGRDVRVERVLADRGERAVDAEDGERVEIGLALLGRRAWR